MGAPGTWTPHIRLSYGGGLGGNLETWSNTVRWKTVSFVPTAEQLQAACDGLVTPLSAWITRPASKVHLAASLRFIKLNWILDTGLQRESNTVQHDVDPAVNGGTSGNGVPFYQTYAITLRTRLKRGRSHAGRVFPPCVIHDAENQFSPYTTGASVDGMANSFATLLRDCRAAMGTIFNPAGGETPDPAVFSAASPPKAPAPLWSPIISVVVDRLPDVQHRRTKSVARSEGTTILIDPA